MASQMRTQSIVMEVPSSEMDSKVSTMECFGWGLHAFHEVVRTGNTTISPTLLGDYEAKTEVFRSVKLHFVRDLTMPRLDEIRRLESEFRSLKYPTSTSNPWAVSAALFALAVVLSVIGGFYIREIPKMNDAPPGHKAFAVMFFFFLVACALFFGIRSLVLGPKKRREVEDLRRKVITKASDLQFRAMRLVQAYDEDE
jgi:hypothetical protein